MERRLFVLFVFFAQTLDFFGRVGGWKPVTSLSPSVRTMQSWWRRRWFRRRHECWWEWPVLARWCFRIESSCRLKADLFFLLGTPPIDSLSPSACSRCACAPVQWVFGGRIVLDVNWVLESIDDRDGILLSIRWKSNGNDIAGYRCSMFERMTCWETLPISASLS